MSDWPSVRPLPVTPLSFMSSSSALCGLSVTAHSSGAWPAANLALFMPVRLPTQVTVYKLVVGCGATAGGNFDVGVYDSQGNRLVSSGSTARSASSEVVCDVTDTKIGPGLVYLAMSADGTDNYMRVPPPGTTPVPLQTGRLLGVLQMATAFVLPATATFAALSNAYVPLVGAYLRPH